MVMFVQINQEKFLLKIKGKGTKPLNSNFSFRVATQVNVKTVTLIWMISTVFWMIQKQA